MFSLISTHFFFSRYKEFNVKWLSFAKLYNRDVPEWLWNRCIRFVEHCLSRLQSDVTISDIQRLVLGHYKVKSQSSEESKEYKVIYRDYMPSYTCINYQRHHWPCKHMLAIFSRYPDNGWDTFPDVYRNCPMFNLDLGTMTHSETLTDATAASWTEAATDSYEETNETSSLPDTKRLDDTAAKNRELLKNLINFTYSCDNVNTLDEMKHYQT